MEAILLIATVLLLGFVLIYLIGFNQSKFKPGDKIIRDVSITEFSSSYPEYEVVKVGKRNYLLKDLRSRSGNFEYERLITVVDYCYLLWKN